MLLFYIRHGDPIYAPDSLTPLGKRQAEAVAKRIAMHGIDKIYASTSNRAYETAVPLSELTKKEIIKIDFFNEKYAWDYFSIPIDENKKKWVGSIPEIRKLFVSDEIYKLGYKWYDHPNFNTYPFKEGMEFYENKIDEFILSLGYKHDRQMHNYKVVHENNDRVALFAHDGFSGIFMSYILDIPYPIYVAHNSLSHTGVTVIEFKNADGVVIPNVLQASNDAHLYKEGLPTYYGNRIFI